MFCFIAIYIFYVLPVGIRKKDDDNDYDVREISHHDYVYRMFCR